MIYNKKEFTGGIIMMAVFVVVLIIFFSPVFDGKNGLDYLDNLYNTISKGSAYYIDTVRTKTEPFAGNTISVALKMDNAEQAEQTAKLFNGAGALVNVSGDQVKVNGDLAQILAASLTDADAMYHNQGDKLSGKYGYDARQALYNWWKALTGTDKDLTKQKKFKEAKVTATVVKQAVETAYNYYGVEAQNIGDKIGIVIFSLIFYVIYTLWYGFAIMYMFEGWGLAISH
jgi:hypothetical protein